MTEALVRRMVRFYDGNCRDIAHSLKVYAWARTIGRLEGLDEETQETLECAAIVHDIACPLCREKYGNTNGRHQEEESEGLLRPLLAEFDFLDRVRERIIYLVTHHHTYTDVDGIDYQILLEADFLVNADEGGYGPEAIASFRDRVFRTRSGSALLEDIFLHGNGK